MKKCFRIGIPLILFAGITRFIFIIFPVIHPDVYCYNEKGEEIDLDKDIVKSLISNARATQSEWKINPLTISDYLRVFFWGDDEFEPRISIVDSQNGKGSYALTFSRFRFGYYVTYIMSKDLEVMSIGFDAKT